MNVAQNYGLSGALTEHRDWGHLEMQARALITYTLSPRVNRILCQWGYGSEQPAKAMFGVLGVFYNRPRPAETRQVVQNLVTLDAGRFSSVRKYHDYLLFLFSGAPYRLWLTSTVAGHLAIRGIARSQGTVRRWWDWMRVEVPEGGLQLAGVLLHLADLARAEELWNASRGD